MDKMKKTTMPTPLERAIKTLMDGGVSFKTREQAVRAVLAAVYSPSADMIAAGAKHIPGSSARECAMHVWIAMHTEMMMEE